MRNMKSREQGVVLIVVLWVCTLLTVLLGAFTLSINVDRTLAGNLVQQVRERAATEAVLNYLTAVRRVDAEAWQAMPGEVFELPFDGIDVFFRLIPESSYLNLNLATEEQLAGVFTALDLEDPQGLARQVVSRRDGTMELSETGTPPQPWYSVDELAMLAGGLERVNDLHRLFTVYGEHEQIDPTYADNRLLNDDQAEPVGEVLAEDGLFRLQIALGAGRRLRKVEVTAAFTESEAGYQVLHWNLYNASFAME